jgi:hypothetical protein
MKWVKKMQQPPKAGDRRLKRKFLFLPRSFVRNQEKHSYWLQFADVEEELQKVWYESGDYITAPYEEWYELKWIEIGVKETK